MSGISFEGRLYPYREGETVLETLVRGGVQVNYSCRRGTCQACVLQIDGDVTAVALTQLRLPRARLDAGTFLACQTLAAPLSVKRLARNELFVPARLVERAQLDVDILRIRLEPPGSFMWHPGQFVNIRHPNGAVRSYAITSLAALDYWLELHVQCRPGGSVGVWLRDELQLSDFVELQGPFGDCHYDRSMFEHPLLLIANGVGTGTLMAVARDAGLRGHQPPISVHYASGNGGSDARGVYLEALARELPANNPNLTVTAHCSDSTSAASLGLDNTVNFAFTHITDLANTTIFLCGEPEFVQRGTTLAQSLGLSAARIRSIAFAPQL